ncbi:MAG: hypothetical protein ACRBDL_06515 [Alphaproteobacteria bacterium]
MENSIDHVDDFEDDFDEVWIDELEEAESGDIDFDSDIDALEISDSQSLEPSSPQRSKKKKGLAPFIVIALLSGAGFGGYQAYEMGLLFQNPENDVIPVVQLSKTESPIILDQNDTISVDPISDSPTEYLPLQQGSIPEDSNAVNQDNTLDALSIDVQEAQDNVLTPMPFDIGTSPIELPDLEEVENSTTKTDISAPPQTAPITTQEEEIQSPILDEDTLITKTESVFDNDEIPIIDSETVDTHSEMEKEAPLPPIDEVPTTRPDLSLIQDSVEPLIEDIVTHDAQSIQEIASPKNNADLPLVEEVQQEKTVPPHEILPQKVVETVKAYKPVWSIRAIQPGRAVIREEKTGEMKSVEIGDTVTGLGRIKSIDKKSGQWVIKGTSGTVIR